MCYSFQKCVQLSCAIYPRWPPWLLIGWKLKIENRQNHWMKRIIDSYTSSYWRSGISSTSVRNSVFSRVERSGTSGKTLNFSHEWKKSQIFNKDECKYLFLPFQLKNKACRFHSFIRMSMSCLLHKILQRNVQCSKYTLI